MATDLGPEFLEKYNTISNKLKKRFLRKPNVSEATEEFSNLAVQSELAEQPPFAGLCYLGAARCEGSVGNSVGETEYLLMSARQFMKAQLKLSSLKCISPARENLEAAISCYCHASSRYPDKSPLRVSINLELAENLKRLGHLGEAVHYYQNAIENNQGNDGHTLNCLSEIAGIYIQQEKYIDALNIFNKIDDIAKEKKYNSFLQRSEVNRLLLYLIVQPSPKSISPATEKLLEKYSLDSNDEGYDTEEALIHPELFLHLQSVLSSCKNNDIKTLIKLQSEIKNYLSLEQQDLMRTILQLYNSMM